MPHNNENGAFVSPRSIPAYGQTRRKVTSACDACRKRRVKCTGVIPCGFCVSSKKQCIFDDTNRARRGPRPRQPANQAPKAPCNLQPAPPKAIAGPLTDAGPISAATPDLVPSGNAVAGGGDDDVDGSHDGGDGGEAEADQPPETSTWLPGLENVLFGGKRAISSSDKAHLGLVCHLIELYWSRTSTWLSAVLLHEDFIDRLRRGSCSRHLIFAICACHFAQRAREELDSCVNFDYDTSHFQTRCFLIEFEISRGNGSRVWVDIAITNSLIQLDRVRLSDNMDQKQILDATANYLSIAEVLVCIGNPGLQPILATKRKLHESEKSGEVIVGLRGHVSEMLYSLIRVQELCGHPFAQQQPSPWSLDSKFRVIQDDLDGFLIRWPDTSFHDQATSQLSSRYQDASASVCVLICHCSMILLNRTFLPIPERARGSDVAEASNIFCVNFPLAPKLFLEERISRCEASAAAICMICKEIVANGQLFSQAVWVGFSCMQSALVLINQLHRKLKPYDKSVVDNLKFTFIVLQVITSFFTPASDWIEMLFRVHDINTPLTHQMSSPEDAFSSFFGRYLSIQEPGFVPLDPKGWQLPRLSSSDDPPDQRPEQPDEVVQKAAEEGKDDWIMVYTSHLEGDKPSEQDTDLVAQRGMDGARSEKSSWGQLPKAPETNQQGNTSEHEGAAGDDSSVLAAETANIGFTSVAGPDAMDLSHAQFLENGTTQDDLAACQRTSMLMDDLLRSDFIGAEQVNMELWQDTTLQLGISGENWASNFTNFDLP